jgi:hypothetical protein
LADRKSFLLRIDPDVQEALRRWADDDLRSLNGQVEFLLRRALTEAGRLAKPPLAQQRGTDEAQNVARKRPGRHSGLGDSCDKAT